MISKIRGNPAGEGARQPGTASVKPNGKNSAEKIEGPEQPPAITEFVAELRVAISEYDHALKDYNRAIGNSDSASFKDRCKLTGFTSYSLKKYDKGCSRKETKYSK